MQVTESTNKDGLRSKDTSHITKSPKDTCHIMRSPKVEWAAGAPGPLLSDGLGFIYWLHSQSVNKML